jgi:cytochrome b561
MQINFTRLYRLWYLLTTLSVLGIFTTYFTGYDPIDNFWNEPLHYLHTLFVGILFAAVTTRVYMALNKINAVPLMHLLHARTVLEAIVAIGYIAMCTALLITLFSDIYLLVVAKGEAMARVRELRDATQPIFAVMVAVHILYVLYLNVVKKRGTLRKLLLASDA